MFGTPKKKSQNRNSNNNQNMASTSTTTSHSPSKSDATVFENGTMMGSVTTSNFNADNNFSKNLVIPEIVISASYSSSLHRSRCDVVGQQQELQHATADCAEIVAESTALLDGHSDADGRPDDFEQFVLNRTTSDSNILDSSIYSELQFAQSNRGCVENGISSGGSTAHVVAAPQQATNTPTQSTVVDILNSSTCSRESRQSKRTRRKHKTKSKCNAASTTEPRAATGVDAAYPPQYTAIFLDPHHHYAGAANAMGQIASAAASAPYLGAPVGTDYNYQHQHLQFFQQQPMFTTLGRALGHHLTRPLLEARAASRTALSMCGSPVDGFAGDVAGSGTPTTTSAITPPLRNSFRKWFSRPSLPFIIGILALGGVACTLGGIVLGSTGLIEHSTQYLSAALLMIGIGVSLLVISGAIWRLSLPDDVDECPCYRHMETCRNCNSPYCNNRLLPGNYLYPEFQHRPPPPSYLTSLNECAAMGLLFHPAAPQPQAPFGAIRGNTPPPLYRSTNSLSVFVPGSFTASPQPSTTVPMSCSNSSSVLPDQNAVTMSVVMENLQAQTQPLTKEIHYLELD